MIVFSFSWSSYFFLHCKLSYFILGLVVLLLLFRRRVTPAFPTMGNPKVDHREIMRMPMTVGPANIFRTGFFLLPSFLICFFVHVDVVCDAAVHPTRDATVSTRAMGGIRECRSEQPVQQGQSGSTPSPKSSVPGLACSGWF